MTAFDTTYDAIVIGSGISGGWAAKELCDKGLKTLVLERGRGVQHIKDYPTMNTKPWELPHRGAIARHEACNRKRYFVGGFMLDPTLFCAVALIAGSCLVSLMT